MVRMIYVLFQQSSNDFKDDNNLIFLADVFLT